MGGQGIMKLCIDCQHFNRGATQCRHRNNTETSMVSGLTIYPLGAQYLRQMPQLCGPDAKWFQPRKTEAA